MNKLFVVVAILYVCASIGLPICKLCGIINISWGLILCPLWIPIVLIYAIILIVFAGMLFNNL